MWRTRSFGNRRLDDTRHMANDRSRCIEDIESDVASGCVCKPVVDDYSIPRIERVRHFGRERSVSSDITPIAHCIAGLEEVRCLFRERRRQLAKNGVVIDDPHAATICRDDEVIILERDVTIRGVRQILDQRLPMISVVERHVYPTLRSSEQKASLLRVISNHARETSTWLTGWETVHDSRPRFSGIVRAKEVWRIIADSM